MSARRMFAAAAFAAVVTVLAGVVSAHHSTAGYDNKTTSVLKGTVVEFRWRNPHVTLIWDVKDESGTVTRWTGEMLSPISETGNGLTRDSLKAGQEISVTVHPGPNAQALVLGINDAQGKVVLKPQNFGAQQ